MLTIGVFGVGHLGKFHLNNWKEISGVTIAGFYDPSNENAAAAADLYKIKRYKKIDDLIDA